MEEILCTAQVWGNGPLSKLASILGWDEGQRSFRYLNASGKSRAYFLPGVPYTQVALRARDLREAFSRSGALLSVMNPELAIAARHCGLRVYYVDSLAWFWEVWDELDLGYYERFRELVEPGRLSLERLLEILRYMNPYDLQWAAHAVSDVSLAQRCFPLSGRRREILSLSGRSMTTGAIVARGFEPGHPVESGRVLVSANSCFNNPDYLPFISEVFRLVAEQRKDFSFSILSSLPAGAGSLSENCRVLSVGREEYIRLLNGCTRFYSPPGLTGLLENLSLGNTPCLLPAQHAGQEKNRRMVQKHLPALPVVGWGGGVLSTAAIVALTREALRDRDTLQRYAERIVDTWELMGERGLDPAVSRFIGEIGDRGAQEIVGCVR